jgi:predicted nucleic-acid-binding protein
LTGLDSSVLIRFLTQDDPAQGRIATKVIEEAIDKGHPLYVSLPVLCETIWVLSRSYKLTREVVADVLDELLTSAVLELEQAEQVNESLGQYRQGRAGFTDYLIGALAKARGCESVCTFDRALRGADGFRLL